MVDGKTVTRFRLTCEHAKNRCARLHGPMSSRASASLISGVTEMGARVAMSPARTSAGSFASARTRITRSRSVINPTGSSFSMTGTTPTSSDFMIFATSMAEAPEPTVFGDSVMAWRTRMDIDSPFFRIGVFLPSSGDGSMAGGEGI